jgi:hypothetical protein
MTRGIHLKRLTNSDLSLLGLPEGAAGDADPDPRPPVLAEADPVLSGLISEVRTGLEGALQLLEEALSAVVGSEADSGGQGPP